MEIQEIFSHLNWNNDEFPSAVLEEAIARRDEMIPPLLEVLEEVARDPEPFAADEEQVIHLFAIYLLALFREPRAYPLLVKIFSTPGGIVFDLAGEIVTYDLCAILASVSGGNPSGMIELVENSAANEWVRSSAIEGMLTLVACGELSRDEAMARFKGWFYTLERNDSAVWEALVSACADLCPLEVMSELRKAYDDDLIDLYFMSWKDIKRDLARGVENSLANLREHRALITDVKAAMQWMEDSSPADSNPADTVDDQTLLPPEEPDDRYGSLLWTVLQELIPPSGHALAIDPEYGDLAPETQFDIIDPIRRFEPKIGRNDPCPCRSGKKYKKCCGR